MAASGYWTATGTDKPIHSSCGANIIGVKKALVFYRGRPPRGIKTDWNMQEYRLPEATMLTSKQKGCTRKRKQPTEGTQYENFIQPKEKVTDRDDQWSDNRTILNLCITNQSSGEESDKSLATPELKEEFHNQTK
ncbi:unnamed protein product [Camellia sinensis]